LARNLFKDIVSFVTTLVISTPWQTEQTLLLTVLEENELRHEQAHFRNFAFNHRRMPSLGNWLLNYGWDLYPSKGSAV
jgi:hypothetical protein